MAASVKNRILAINPGSTSTKIAVFDGEKLLSELTIRHSADELKGYKNITDQFGFRKDLILRALQDAGVEMSTLGAVIGRGGLLRPIPSGVYRVNERMRDDLAQSRYGQHASNLGGLLALDIAGGLGIPAFIADPVVVDELQPVARVTGRPEIERVSIFHALNQKAIARRFAAGKGRRYEDMNLIVAHLGGGISVGAHRRGRVVDVNDALQGDGPFSPERAGGLPAWQFAQMCMNGGYSLSEIGKMLMGGGGMVAHLGTNNMIEIADMAEGGDDKAQLLLEAMCYNVGKSIGASAAVLEGDVDAVLITGGMAHSSRITSYIEDMVSFIAPVAVIPGEDELGALATNALRVLQGREVAAEY